MQEKSQKPSYIRSAIFKMPEKFDPPTEGALVFQGLDAESILPMGLNECNFKPSPNVQRAICENVDKIGRYPDAQPPILSEKISELFDTEPENIVWGNGSEELIKGAIDLAVSPGEGIVLPVPTFWGYRGIIAAAGADAKFVDSKNPGKVDVDKILSAVNKNTKLTFCVTPNNPSGELLPEDDIKKLIAKISKDILFVVDEAYYEFGQYLGAPDILSILKNRIGPWIIIRTFSKAYAMAGMRIGYAICSDRHVAQALKKTTCVFNVPILSIAAAKAALSDQEHLNYLMKKTHEGRKQIFEGLNRMGLSPLPSSTNFVSVEVKCSGKTLVAEMLKKKIQIHAWPDPGYEKFIRITVGEDIHNTRFLAVLKQVMFEVSSVKKNL